MSYLAAFGATILAVFIAIVCIGIALYLGHPSDSDDGLITAIVILSFLYLGAVILWLSGTPSPITWN